jgi:hypothetical protein
MDVDIAQVMCNLVLNSESDKDGESYEREIL